MSGYRNTLAGIRFAAVNLYCARELPTPEPQRLDGLTLRTVEPDDLRRFETLNTEFRPGKEFSALRRWTYTRVGRKLLWVVVTPSGEFAALNMYYFREGEWSRRIIHEAFVGVRKKYRGRGLANRMRSAAAASFREGAVRGITTQIERDNVASWRGAQSRGFRETGTVVNGSPLLFRPLDVSP